MLYEAFKKLGKHSAIYALGPAVQKLIGFLLLPIVTAYIGTTGDFGVTEMAAVVIAVASQLVGVNLLHGMTRYYKDYEGESERASLVSTTLLCLVGTTGAFFVIVWFTRTEASALLFGSSRYAPALLVTAGILILQTISQVGLRTLQILERSVSYGVLTTLKLVAEVGSKLWFLVALSLSYMGVLYSVLVGEGLIAAAMLVFLLARFGLHFSRVQAGRLWRYTAPLVLSGLCMFALHQADRFFVLRSWGEDEVGVYALCYKLGSIGNTVVFEAFALIWFPYVFAIKDERVLIVLVRSIATWLGCLSCFVALGLSVFRQEIVEHMAAPEFFEAYRALPWIALGYVFWVLFQIFGTVFYVRERTGSVTWLVGGAALLNLVLNALLVPRLAHAGAAIATAVTFGALALASWLWAERLVSVRYELGRLAVPLCLAAALYFASEHLPELSWGASLTLRGGLVAAFPAILGLGGFLKGGEKAKIKAILNRRTAT